MSFILDALRKSEHARQRSTGPGLAEVPVVASRPKTNVWAWAAVALLVVNLVAVGVLLLKRGARDEPAAPATTVTAAAPAAPSPAPSSAPAATPATAPTTAVTANPTLAPPATTASSTPPPTPPTGGNPLAAEVGDSPGLDPRMAAAAAAPPAGPPAVTSRTAGTPPVKRGSVVYAPVPEANDAPYVEPAPAKAASGGEALPGVDELTASGGLPPLHLDLHVYSTQASQRFIFVNSRKYREGETLAEGPVVEKITPEGAVLDYRGSRFRLSHD